jgi:hypothetical protein
MTSNPIFFEFYLQTSWRSNSSTLSNLPWRNFWFILVAEHYSGDQIKEVHRTCGTHLKGESRNRTLGTPERKCEYNTKIQLQEIRWERVDWTDRTQGKAKQWAIVKTVMNLCTKKKSEEFLDWFHKKYPAPYRSSVRPTRRVAHRIIHLNSSISQLECIWEWNINTRSRAFWNDYSTGCFTERCRPVVSQSFVFRRSRIHNGGSSTLRIQ